MIDKITRFITQTFQNAGKQKAVIGISGGVDSTLSLTLVTRALGAQNIISVMLPYGDQDLSDAEVVLKFNQIPQDNWQVMDIKSVVDTAAQAVGVKVTNKIRFGNLIARTRMMMLYDLAKKHGALVCGTENKSEKYLGYFTRFGDEASDLEPIIHLYKTQVKQLTEALGLPVKIMEKSPSADLWEGQTDEQELGFSYEVADQVLRQLIDEKKLVTEIKIDGVTSELIEKVVHQVEQMKFKQQVPYRI